MQNPFVSDFKHYMSLAQSQNTAYTNAQAFPHVHIDDFVPEELCDLLLKEFPDPRDACWTSFNDPTGIKLASSRVTMMGLTTQQILGYFNSAAFLQFLETLTGIDGLIPDPWFEGGGLHQIQKGGYLKIHADFNRHEKLKLDRRVNVLLYLNANWREEYGGHLELWNKDMSCCVERILPKLNRLVVFNTTDTSFHGHPQPLNCPDGNCRRSLALYYYTNGRPAEEVSESHSTLYQATPEERQRMQSRGFRIRQGCSESLEFVASLLNKPSALIRRIGEWLRPQF